jgi:ABC-type branched-subunit amino acid transport system substrate-binding protein
LPGGSSQRAAGSPPAGVWAVRAVAIVVLGLTGCSLDRFDHDACATHADCRTAFGFGAVCGDRGLCQRASVPPRCGASYPEDLFSDAGRYRQAIVLGSLVDRSSPAQRIRGKAARLAVKSANIAGGIDGRPFALVECDIRQDLNVDRETRIGAAVASALFLSRTLGVAAIIGPSASGDVEQVWKAVHGDGTLVISPAATSSALNALEPEVSPESPGLLWRTAPSDSVQGKRIAEDLRARKITRATIIREAGPYGEGLTRVFAANFALPGETLEIISLPGQGEDQIDAVVAGLRADDPGEVLFISSQPSWVVRFLNRAAAEPAMASRSIFLTDAAASEEVLTAVSGGAALFPRVRGSRPAPLDANDFVFASFIADYRAEYGGESPTTTSFSAHAYDAAWLTVYGASWSLLQEGTVSGPGIGRGFTRLRGGGTVPIVAASFPGILSSLRTDRSLDVTGASGSLDFDPNTRELAAPVEIWTITSANGQLAITGAGPGDKTSTADTTAGDRTAGDNK